MSQVIGNVGLAGSRSEPTRVCIRRSHTLLVKERVAVPELGLKFGLHLSGGLLYLDVEDVLKDPQTGNRTRKLYVGFPGEQPRWLTRKTMASLRLVAKQPILLFDGPVPETCLLQVRPTIIYDDKSACVNLDTPLRVS